jgi:hypothetical protein
LARNDVDTPIGDLEAELVAAATRETGAKREVVLVFLTPALQRLRELYGGRSLYIPANEPRTYDVAAMRRMLAETQDPDAVCRTFSVSRRTLYRKIGEAAPRKPGK